jgi:hypothetical protein
MKLRDLVYRVEEMGSEYEDDTDAAAIVDGVAFSKFSLIVMGTPTITQRAVAEAWKRKASELVAGGDPAGGSLYCAFADYALHTLPGDIDLLDFIGRAQARLSEMAPKDYQYETALEAMRILLALLHNKD